MSGCRVQHTLTHTLTHIHTYFDNPVGSKGEGLCNHMWHRCSSCTLPSVDLDVKLNIDELDDQCLANGAFACVAC
eukprot:39342-Chlamydomonas_euryale.AAC.3